MIKNTWEACHGQYMGGKSWEILGRDVMGNIWEGCYGKYRGEKLIEVCGREVMRNN